MIGGLSRLAQPFLMALDAEKAHGLTIRALEAGLYPRGAIASDPIVSQRFWDLDFPNPLGMAAGFDKNAQASSALLAIGFGFAEAGSLTPLPQPGNPRPRLFRLPADEGVINRLGFNNEGHAAALARLTRNRPRGVLGVNIGANKDSEDRTADYVAGVRAFAHVASYFTANISSPNTPGLRDLQHEAALADLLSRIVEARDEMALTHGRRVPVLVKIAPDLLNADLEIMAGVFLRGGVDGLVISNTTLERDGLVSPMRDEAGGLSGKPLFNRSTVILARMRQLVGNDLPIIGVGGIHSADSAWEKLRAGANLLQIYSALVYGGIGLAADIVSGIAARMRREGVRRIADITSSGVNEWAARKP